MINLEKSVNCVCVVPQTIAAHLLQVYLKIPWHVYPNTLDILKMRTKNNVICYEKSIVFKGNNYFNNKVEFKEDHSCGINYYLLGNYNYDIYSFQDKIFTFESDFLKE